MTTVAQTLSPRDTTLNPSAPPVAKRGFSALDDYILNGSGGAVLARVGSEEAGRALGNHVARRLADRGLFPLASRCTIGAPLWREAASVLNVTRLTCNPRQCAEDIADTAVSRRVALIVPLPKRGTWDRSVAAELSTVARSPFIVFLSYEADDDAPDLRVEAFDVEETLDADDKRRWWTAAALQASTDTGDEDLIALDTGWGGLRARPSSPDARPPMLFDHAPAKALFQALALAGRAWHVADVGTLGGDTETLETLVRAGAVRVVRGWAVLERGYEDHAERVCARASHEATTRVARALLARFSDDPWTLARAAELLVQSGACLEGDVAHVTALAHADDPLARREVIARWSNAVSSAPSSEQLTLRVRAAERALAVGEAEEAYQWAQGATALAKDDVSVTLLFGRAAVSLGDLVAAKVALDRGRELAGDDETRAMVASELAEVAYRSGDLEGAERLAQATLGVHASVEARFKARNTLGKILLARAMWDDAERHFAEDTWNAASSGLATEELRARFNRGIALLSKGSLDEARAVFEAGLVTGEQLGDTRACALALHNLAVVATRKRDYAQALELLERTLTLRLRLGDRISTALVLANLAELRRRLGLFEHAEHAVAFGRQMLGAGMPTARALDFCLVAAHIALAKNHASHAWREVTRLVEDSKSAGALDYLNQAYRIGTRVALEDGDLPRAREFLACATEHAKTEAAHTEAVLLRALIARAAGEDAEAPALEALALARRLGDDELLLEAHTILIQTYALKGSAEKSRFHLDQAIIARDRMTDPLPEGLRTTFLARPDMVALEKMWRTSTAQVETDPADGVGLYRATPRQGLPREIVGDAPSVRALRSVIARVARSNSTILVRGESGTGKELVAEAIHRASDRADGPLVTVNCAALVETLLLSELFGHEKGAFTGAFTRRRGRFEIAEGGTLFLDEIGDISPRTQVALLRVLQERVFERVGGTSSIRADVRILCATHRDLRSMVDRGEFREDLYYRLRGITLEVPPLRERIGDLPCLSEHLLARIAAERGDPSKTLADDALELLHRHPWPGNVRELENVLRAAFLFAEGNVITAACLLDTIDDLRRPNEASIQDPSDGRDEGSLPVGKANATAIAYSQVRRGTLTLPDMKRLIERDCIANALTETKRNITQAAVLLGMKRSRLSQLVKQYGLADIASEAT